MLVAKIDFFFTCITHLYEMGNQYLHDKVKTYHHKNYWLDAFRNKKIQSLKLAHLQTHITSFKRAPGV